MKNIKLVKEENDSAGRCFIISVFHQKILECRKKENDVSDKYLHRGR
jgi:hypothetical protein